MSDQFTCGTNSHLRVLGSTGFGAAFATAIATVKAKQQKFRARRSLFHSQVKKSIFFQPFIEKCMSDAMTIWYSSEKPSSSFFQHFLLDRVATFTSLCLEQVRGFIGSAIPPPPSPFRLPSPPPQIPVEYTR